MSKPIPPEQVSEAIRMYKPMVKAINKLIKKEFRDDIGSARISIIAINQLLHEKVKKETMLVFTTSPLMLEQRIFASAQARFHFLCYNESLEGHIKYIMKLFQDGGWNVDFDAQFSEDPYGFERNDSAFIFLKK